MHCSRMHTAHLLPISPSMHCSEEGVPGPGGVYLVRAGCTWSWGVYLVPGGCTWSGGVPGLGGVPGPGWVYLVPRGVPGLGGVPGPRGVPGPGGCTWSRGCTWSGVYLNRMTDRCKNITLPQTSFAGGNEFKFCFHRRNA